MTQSGEDTSGRTQAQGAWVAGGLLVALGLSSLVVYTQLIPERNPPYDFASHYLPRFGILFALYIGAIVGVMRVRGGRSRLTLGAILLFALLFRYLQIWGTPIESDSIRRYLWDGKVLAHGINPYVAAPNDPSLEHLRGPQVWQVPYARTGALSPPLTVLACGLAALIAPDEPLAIKGIAVAFDLLTLLPIVMLLDTLRRPRSLCVVYAWNPLVVKEFANSGHLDSLAIFFLVLGLALCLRGKHMAAGILWGLSAGSKLLAALMPWLAWERVRARGAVVTGVVIVAVFVPFMFAGVGGLRGLWAFSVGEEFNSGLYSFVAAVLQRVMADPHTADKLARAVLAALVAVTAYAMPPTDVSPQELLRRTGMLIACLLLISPIVNPWYVCWLVPFLCFVLSPTWIAFSGLVFLSYLQTAGSDWAEPARVVEYGVLWAGLIWEGLAYRRGDGPLVHLRPAGTGG